MVEFIAKNITFNPILSYSFSICTNSIASFVRIIFSNCQFQCVYFRFVEMKNRSKNTVTQCRVWYRHTNVRLLILFDEEYPMRRKRNWFWIPKQTRRNPIYPWLRTKTNSKICMILVFSIYFHKIIRFSIREYDFTYTVRDNSKRRRNNMVVANGERLGYPSILVAWIHLTDAVQFLLGLRFVWLGRQFVLEPGFCSALADKIFLSFAVDGYLWDECANCLDLCMSLNTLGKSDSKLFLHVCENDVSILLSLRIFFHIFRVHIRTTFEIIKLSLHYSHIRSCNTLVWT